MALTQREWLSVPENLNKVKAIAENSDSYKDIAQKVIEAEGFSWGKDKFAEKISDALRSDPYEGMAREAKAGGHDPKNVKDFWYKTDNYSIRFKVDDNGVTLDDLTSFFKQLIDKPIEHVPPSISSDKSLKVTITDAHVGLEPNPDNDALFPYHYSSDEFAKRLEIVEAAIYEKYELHGHFDMIILDDLGDGLDGWNGQTTRGGHLLPQNMSNLKAFKTFVEGKSTLVRKILEKGICNRVQLRNVTNDNHAGDFSAIANETIKMMMDLLYPQTVKCSNLHKFMEHRIWGDHCFILSHGKDKKYMKRGLPLHLTPIAQNFIRDYIASNNITSKYIHVEKGDLHQDCFFRTKGFTYQNFPSFSPPSTWVQHNFGDTYSGFVVQVIPKHSGKIDSTTIIFEDRKVTQ